MKVTSIEFAQMIETHKTCILPTGAYEQHGPHCVLETDCLTAEYIADRIGQMLNVPVLPVIPFGRSAIHRCFPGTVYISDAVYELFLCDTFRSISESGITNLLIINGHGGNDPIIRNAISAITKESKDLFRANLFNWFEYIDDTIFTPVHRSHAGSMETSVIEYIAPSNIRPDMVVNGERNPQYDGLIQSLITECTLNGVIGRANEHSREKGLACVDLCCRRIIEEIMELKI